jgi:hypothetical protein
VYHAEGNVALAFEPVAVPEPLMAVARPLLANSFCHNVNSFVMGDGSGYNRLDAV